LGTLRPALGTQLPAAIRQPGLLGVEPSSDGEAGVSAALLLDPDAADFVADGIVDDDGVGSASGSVFGSMNPMASTSRSASRGSTPTPP
jgi:hypothetical protein